MCRHKEVMRKDIHTDEYIAFFGATVAGTRPFLH